MKTNDRTKTLWYIAFSLIIMAAFVVLRLRPEPR